MSHTVKCTHFPIKIFMQSGGKFKPSSLNMKNKNAHQTTPYKKRNEETKKWWQEKKKWKTFPANANDIIVDFSLNTSSRVACMSSSLRGGHTCFGVCGRHLLTTTTSLMLLLLLLFVLFVFLLEFIQYFPTIACSLAWVVCL